VGGGSVLRFGSPQLLLWLLVVPLAVAGYLWGERRRAERARRWTSPELLVNMAGGPGLRRRVPPVLFLVGVALLLVGFARPQARFSTVQPGGTVVVALDDSGSMAASDVPPSRLAAADGILTAFVDHLPSTYRVALIVFSADYELKVPPTYDRALFIAGLPKTAALEGSAIGDAVGGAVQIAQKAVGVAKGSARPPAAVLLVSDGGQNAGQLTPAQATALARKAEVPVSSLVLGTPGGVVNQRLRVAGSSHSFVQTTRVPVEAATLAQISAGSGGVAFDQDSAQSGLSEVYRRLGQHLVHGRQLREITVAVTAAALVLILAAVALSGLWFRRPV